jgi:hypothetical protein
VKDEEDVVIAQLEEDAYNQEVKENAPQKIKLQHYSELASAKTLTDTKACPERARVTDCTLSALDNAVRRCPSTVEIQLSCLQSLTNCRAMGRVVDSFLTPQPWWSVSVFCKQANANTISLSLKRDASKPAEAYLRWLVGRQFPTHNTTTNCLPMVLYNSPSRFWGSLIISLLIEGFGSATDTPENLEDCGKIGAGIVFAPQMWQSSVAQLDT